MAAPSRRRADQSIEEKLTEIGLRSPTDLAAFHVLADEVLGRLDARDSLSGAKRRRLKASLTPPRSATHRAPRKSRP